MVPNRKVVLASAALFLITTACPATIPMMEGDREREWNVLFTAPIHVEAELVSTPVVTFGPWFHSIGPHDAEFATCAADAVTRVVFSEDFRIGRLAVGGRFRFTWNCFGSGNWFIHGHTDSLHTTQPNDRVGGYARGQKFELFLSHAFEGSRSLFEVAGPYGMKELTGFLPIATVHPEQVPDWYDKRFLTERGASAQLLPPPKNTYWLPSAFPSADVTVTYTSSAQPGRVFSAAYNAAMTRVLINPVTKNQEKNADFVVEDPVVSLLTTISPRSGTYTLKDHVDRVFMAGKLHTAFEMKGTETIAGLQCQIYALPES